MFKPLGNTTFNPSISLLVDSPVKTSPMLEKAKDWQVKDPGCFSRWPESFANFNPEFGSWKTCQRSITGDWMPFLDRWPKSGLMQCGVTYRLDLWVPPISVIGGSVLGGKWATPQAFDATGIQRSEQGWEKQRKRKGGGMPKNLREEIQKWSTPLSCDVNNMTFPPSAMKQKSGIVTEIMKTAGFKNQTTERVWLNPDWVECLMGFPIGWTRLIPNGQPGETTQVASSTGSQPEPMASKIQKEDPE